MIITLTMNPSIDYILQVPELRMEDTLRAQNAFFQSGGKGINVSRVLTRLEIENTAWGFCGGDTGNWLRSFLDEEHVAHDFIQTQAQTRINTIITETTTHKQLRTSAPGGRILNQEEQLLLDRFKNLPLDAEWIALGGSHPPAMRPNLTRHLIELANAAGKHCVLDADGDVLKEGILGKPYLIKPNQYELERLLGQPVNSLEQIVTAARTLIQQGWVTLVVTSQAEAGAILVSTDEVFVAKAPQVKVVSKVGAGDSMVAGLLKGLMENAPLPKVLQMGVASGTAAVMTPSNELCHKHNFEMLLPQIQVESLVLS